MSKTDTNKMHQPRENITLSITMFDQTKQIITDIDKLLHSTTLHNKVLQSLHLNGMCVSRRSVLYKISLHHALCSPVGHTTV